MEWNDNKDYVDENNPRRYSLFLGRYDDSLIQFWYHDMGSFLARVFGSTTFHFEAESVEAAKEKMLRIAKNMLREKIQEYNEWLEAMG